MGSSWQVILCSSPVLTYSFTGIKPHVFTKVTQNVQVKQGGEFFVSRNKEQYFSVVICLTKVQAGHTFCFKTGLLFP